MKLKVGDVLVKKRGGGAKRVEVLCAPVRDALGTHVLIQSIAKSNSKSTNARQWWVSLGDNDLPDGYKRAES